MKPQKHNLSDIALRIKTVRDKLNITQVEMAKKLDISYSHYSKIEVGMTTCSDKFLRKFCEVCKVDYDWLVAGGTDDASTKPITVDYCRLSREELIQEVAEMAGDEEVMSAARQLQKVLGITLGQALDFMLRERGKKNKQPGGESTP